MADENKTPRKSPDYELIRLMVQLSNNSRMTEEAAVILTNALSQEDLGAIKRWMQHAKRQKENELMSARNRGRPFTAF